MRKPIIAVSTTALLLAAPGVALAQSGSSGSGTSAGATSGSSTGGSPVDVTCREITALDTETVAGVLYFISGYREGERASGSMTTSGTMGGAGASLGQDTASASGATSGSGSAATGSGSDLSSTDTAANSSGSGSAATGSDLSSTGTASSSTGAGSATGASGAASTDMAATGGTSGAGSSSMETTGSPATAGGAPQIAALQGYFTIPVEQTIVACGAEPDSRVSDVLDQQGQGGMTTQPSGGGASDTGSSTAQ